MTETNQGKIVLDKGFVRLVDFMGGDDAVVQSARVSYGQGLKTPEQDERLIQYLMKNHHTTPFEHSIFKFHVKLPIFVARQFIRHRVGQSFNEISARYTEMKEEFYLPKEWRLQDVKNKQSSHGVVNPLNFLNVNEEVKTHCEQSMRLYKHLIGLGIAREMARMVLPVNLYTEWYWTVNAQALMHFIRLRSDSHAQWEAQEYSYAFAEFFQQKMPWTCKAFLNALEPAHSYPMLFLGKAEVK